MTERPDHLVATIARIIVAIERRRGLQVIDGGKPMQKATRKAG